VGKDFIEDNQVYTILKGYQQHPKTSFENERGGDEMEALPKF
jgi:hypothetical protein